MLMSTGIVSRVVVFAEDDPREFIREVRPQVHCIGIEYLDKCIEADLCHEMGIRLVLVPKAGRWSTTTFGEAYTAFLRGLL
jgi:bifunctional ADP-heptose synthase (sugar kinase/adenylyltransferase)